MQQDLGPTRRPRVAEFFAGIGLVRAGLGDAFEIVFANDIDSRKQALYRANFDESPYLLADIRSIKGSDIPEIDLATASFPCTDLSVAGNRTGLHGAESGTFWEFARVLEEMGGARPPVILMENVVGFATSHGGHDLADAVNALNVLGYVCHLRVIDARLFVPQSRPRLFILGTSVPSDALADPEQQPTRPTLLDRFVETHSHLRIGRLALSLPEPASSTLAGIVQRFSSRHSVWWDRDRTQRFVDSLSTVQHARLDALQVNRRTTWATAYRRTRQKGPTWEIRRDLISGCLRTARGGSSRQAVVEAGRGKMRIRWMTAREYARLQGAPEFSLENVTESQAIFALGDAVCVPVISFLSKAWLLPLLANAAPKTSRNTWPDAEAVAV